VLERSNRTPHAALLGLCILLTSSAGHAYTIETVITRGCHEEVTADALRAARKSIPKIAKPLPLVGDDRALIDDVAFTVEKDLRDIGAVALVLGVRDNDVKSFAATALDELAPLNSDPDSQNLHCLRRPEQDEPGGSEAAVNDCRTFIRKTLISALDGVGADGFPDGNKRERLDVTLSIRGDASVDVPMFYLRVGRAFHTIQDSFTHTFRSIDDRHKITVVLNWVDYAEKRLSEARDGPAHMQELDRCDNPDDLRAERRRSAVDACATAIEVLLDPTTDADAKAIGIDAMLDKYVSFDPDAHCTADNRWCNAPENAYAGSNCFCTAIGLRSAPSAPGSAVGLLGFIAWRRRRRGDRPLPTRAMRADGIRVRRVRPSRSFIGLLALALATISRRACAEAPAKPSAGPDFGAPLVALKGQSKAGSPNTEDKPGAFFARVALGASYQKPGFEGGIGGRYQFSHPYMIGLDVELNPWIATTPNRVRLGAFNSYVSVIRRFQLKSDSVNVRSQVGLGVSVLLIDLVGAPSGSFGPFFGLSFLGVEWKLTPGFYLTIDPTYIALPVPHVTGAPFGYLQYRFLVGVEFGG
jgi:hypothetical protein